MTKRVFPAILALLFVLVSFAPAAFAAEDNGTLRLNDAIARALNQNSGLKLQGDDAISMEAFMAKFQIGHECGQALYPKMKPPSGKGVSLD